MGGKAADPVCFSGCVFSYACRKHLKSRLAKYLGRAGQAAFERENAYAVFACGIGDYNPRSRRAFEKVGFEVCATIPEPPGRKGRLSHDLILTRDRYSEPDA